MSKKAKNKLKRSNYFFEKLSREYKFVVCVVVFERLSCFEQVFFMADRAVYKLKRSLGPDARLLIQ